MLPATRFHKAIRHDRRGKTLPTMYDLPSEFPEEPGLPDVFHDLQPQLLSRTLHLADYSSDNWFTGSDLNVYYDVHHQPWHKCPDWFLAVNVPRLYDGYDLRRSYVVWQEGQAPAVVVEFLSPRTEREDLGRFYSDSDQIADEPVTTSEAESVSEPEALQIESDETSIPDEERLEPPDKFEVYESYLRVPHYIVYSRYTRKLRYFKLIGRRYEEQSVQLQNPVIWLDDLKVGLGFWQGEFEDVPGYWLRWCDESGNWLLTDTEAERVAKEEAQQQARTAQEQADAAQERADRLAERFTRARC